LKPCKPQLYASVASTAANGSVTNVSTPVIMPCGLAAWAYFNDTYSFVLQPATPGTCAAGLSPMPNAQCNMTGAVSATGLAFNTDLTTRFAARDPPVHFNDNATARGGGAQAVQRLSADERFVGWMRTPALSTFRKLWGRMDGVTLRAGDVVTVAVGNNWNSYGFGGAKTLVLSTSSWLGGANDFIGIAYLSVGALCLVLGLAFAALSALKERRLGDPALFSWNKAKQR